MGKQSAAKPNRAERTRGAILAAAEDHFSRFGFAATRLEDIADELDSTRAAQFYSFKDKQALFDAMVADSFGARAEKLNDLLELAIGA